MAYLLGSNRVFFIIKIKKMKIINKNLVWVFILIGFFYSVSDACAQQFIRFVPKPVLTKAQQHYLSVIVEDEVYVGHQFVTVNPDVLRQESALNIPLFKASESELSVSEINYEERQANNYSWFGQVDGYPLSSVILTNVGEHLFGRIEFNGESFSIIPIGEGLYVLRQENEGKLPQDESDEGYREMMKTSVEVDRSAPVFDPEILSDTPENTSPFATPPPAPLAGNCKIRLLIAYTDDVATAHVGELAAIQNAVDGYNLANSNSTVNHRVEIARCVEVSYAEATGACSGTNMKNDFKGTSDGKMDNIHGLRNYYDADMCALVFESSKQTCSGFGLCGLADVIGSSYSTAFQITKYSCLNSSLAHEFGHLMNARHDPYVDGSGGYNHGRTYPAGAWRTQMAYNDACVAASTSCTRVKHWSDPSVNYLGTPTGIVGTSENEKAMDLYDNTVSAFESYVVNKTVNVTDNIYNEEEGNITATTTIQTNTSYPITYWSGSEGTYTAGTSIVFKPGFHARSGCHFRAYLDNCTNNFFAPGDDDIASAKVLGETGGDLSFAEKLRLAGTNIGIYPNPSNGQLTLAYTVSIDEGTVNISLYDAKGMVIDQILNESNHDEGSFTIKYDGKSLPKGIYYCRMVTNDKVVVKPITITD